MAFFRRALRIAGITAAVLALCIVVAVAVTQTAWFRERLRHVVIREAAPYLNGELRIGRLDGNLFSGLELRGVSILQEGVPVVAADNIALEYNLGSIISSGVVIDGIALTHPVIVLKREASGWNLPRLVKRRASEEGQSGPGRPLAIRRVAIVNGRVVIRNTDLPVSEIDGLQARFALAYAPVKLEVTIDRLGFDAKPANLAVRALTGKVALEGDDLHLNGIDVVTARSEVHLEGVLSDYAGGRPRINASLTSPRLSPGEFGGLVPALATVGVVPALNVDIEGPFDALRVGFHMRSSAGDSSGRVTADATAPTRGLKGTIDARQLDLAPFLGDPSQRTRITGRLTVDLRVPESGLSAARGQFAFDGPETSVAGYTASGVAVKGTLDGTMLRFDGRAMAYRARTTAAGHLVLPVGERSIAYELSGDVSSLDLRNLPSSLGVPPLESRIAGHYTLRGTPGSIDAAVLLRPSALAGATFGQGTRARAALQGRRLEYSATGSVSGLDLERLGAALRIPALAQDRYASDLNGTFDLRGSGRMLDDLAIAATGTFADSSFTGVRLPTVAVDITLAHRALRAGVRGDFTDLDPSALGVARLGGSDINGSADVTVRLANLGGEISLASVKADGAVRLGPSTVAGLVVNQAELRGNFEDRVFRVERLDANGPAAAMSASGLLAFDETTPSDVQYHLEGRDLAEMGKAFGAPIAGVLAVDGRIGGTAADLTTRGTLSGERLRYGTSVDVLALNSDFTVRVPDFDPARASVDARTEATSIRAGGQDIQRLTAATRYAGQQLDFETTADAGPRSLVASGRLLVHEDHRELHLQGLTLGPQDATWSLPAGTEARVQYGDQRLRVHDLVLERGPQRISIEGAVPIGQVVEGQPPAPAGAGPARIDLRAEHVQLADVGRLMFGDSRLGGEMNATASLSGTFMTPVANAEFSVVNGNLGGVPIDSLAGKLDVRDQQLGLDVTLDQSPGQGLTARGHVPLPVLRTPPGASHPEEEAARARAASEAMDVHVQTTRLNLALVGGLTTSVTNVTGIAEADVHVVGTLADPHLQGHVSISDGAFTPASTGAQYTGLEAQVRLEPDRVFIDHLRVNDDDGDPLTMSGSLAVHEQSVGDVDVTVAARKFELIDNELGDVDADVNLHLTGTVTQPRLVGELAVHSGRIEADRVLARATAGSWAPVRPEQTRVTDAMIAELERLPDRMRQEDAAAAARAAVTGSTGTTPPATSTASPAPAGAEADGATPTKPAPEGSALDRLAMDVRVRVPDNLVVRGQDLRTESSSMAFGNLNVTLGGDLTLQKATDEAGGPAIRGSVDVVHGFYEFQGRRFDVVRGSELRFEGFRPMNPRLRIDAEREISGVVAQVHLRGSMRRPQLNLTSQPPLDPSDILSLIVFNAPVNELGSSERSSLTEQAGALAAGFIADPLTRSLGRALDLDYFEIRASGDRGEPSVGVGEQIGGRLYVRFQQQFGSDQASQLQFEYRIADFLRLMTSVAEGSQTSRSPTRRVESQAVDLIFQWSY